MSLESNTYSPSVIVPMVHAVVKPEVVGDWGCNCGVWLDAFRRNGVKRVHGFDMQPWDSGWLLLEEEFQQVDFEDHIPVMKCDLAVNLENAEHLRQERADVLVDALTTSAPVVLFSAATPGQGGRGHVNEQPHSYWHAKFARRGFLFFDLVRWAIRDDHNVYPWYRDNIFIYSSIPLPR